MQEENQREVEFENPYSGFQIFCEEWPEHNRVGEDEAARMWMILVDSGAISGAATEVFEGLSRWKHSERWLDEDGKYIPSMAKWLREKLWKDHPKQAQAKENW